MPKPRVMRHAVTQPLKESYRLIPLTKGQNAIVDVEDFDRLMLYNWFASWDPIKECFYAKRWSPKTSGSVAMTSEIINCRKGQEIDHRSGNTLDNRKENIRKCTHAENLRNKKKNKINTSGFKGVSWNSKRRKWIAQIEHSNMHFYLGGFDSKEIAARAYDARAKALFGEFAHLNFPSQ